MGRIRTMLVKRITKELMKEHGDELTTDYLKNKEVIAKYTTTASPKMRNVISGYATKLAKQNEKGDVGPKKDPNRKEDLSKYY